MLKKAAPHADGPLGGLVTHPWLLGGVRTVQKDSLWITSLVFGSRMLFHSGEFIYANHITTPRAGLSGPGGVRGGDGRHNSLG